ncbi:cytochrome P450 [Mycena filopes]|nr:cytochrome P450 [Mycena filopes]
MYPLIPPLLTMLTISTTLQVLVPVVGTILFYILYHAGQVLYRNLTSPIRFVAGPASPSIFVGNVKQMQDDPAVMQEWRDEFGSVFRFKGLFSVSELHASDLKAVTHIVTNGARYQKAPAALVNSRRLFGKGLLGVETSEHKRHRKILNPAFGVSQIRALTEVFVEKSIQLRDIWAQQATDEKNGARIEVLTWMRRMTLDVIGQAGFNYQFHGLEPDHKPNELHSVFAALFHSPEANRLARLRLSQAMVPILRLVPVPGWRITANAREKLSAVGGQIVAESKANMLSHSNAGEKTTAQGGRDLLSLIVKANLTANLPGGQGLDDAEVIAQIPTFFLAGHETTSASAAWALHALSHDQRVQQKLREELLSLPTDNPTMEELNALTYLESVVREVMRVHAPAVFTQRMAMADDILPLGKPYVDSQGNVHESLPISKGQMIHVPILAVNTDKEIWGEDAYEFKPERWENIPERATAIPGVWGNLMTFFAGPHNCIGFRFSITELKCLLFTLIRAFEFTPAVPRDMIKPMMAGILQRPSLSGGSKEGSGLPLIVKPYNAQI